MSNLKFMFVLSLVVTSLSAQAEKYTTSVSIGSIEILNGGNFWIESDASIPGSTCSNYGKLFRIYVGSNLDSTAAQNMLSLAMLAYTTGKPVDIYHSEDSNCLVSRLKISGQYI